MDYRVTPEPDDAQRAAIVEALRELRASGHPAYGSAWRRAALEPDGADDYAVAPPRSSRGATRA